MIDKSRAAKICQLNAVCDKKIAVRYGEADLIPQKLILWFDNKGNPLWSFRAVSLNSFLVAVECNIQDCEELTKEK